MCWLGRRRRARRKQDRVLRQLHGGENADGVASRGQRRSERAPLPAVALPTGGNAAGVTPQGRDPFRAQGQYRAAEKRLPAFEQCRAADKPQPRPRFYDQHPLAYTP